MVAVAEASLSAIVADIVELLLRSYLLLPLAGLYAFPKRQSVWLVLILAAPIAVEFWGSRTESELEPLAFTSAMLLAVTVPVGMLVHGLWHSRLKKWVIVILVLVLGYLGFMATIFYVGEADLHPDEYCWKADREAGSCEPSPWLLAPIAIGLPAMMVVIVGAIPLTVALLLFGWKRRKAERMARSV